MDDLIDYLQARARTPFTVDRAAVSADREQGTEDQALRALSGLGGFLSSLLFLLFLWLADLLSYPPVALSLGTALILGTIWLGRRHRPPFLATTTVCGYLVGIGLIMVGLPPAIPTAYLVIPVLAIAVVTVTLTRNYYLVLLATASLPACLLFLHLVRGEAGWIWLALLVSCLGLVLLSRYEYRLLRDVRFTAIRTGLALGLFFALVYFRWAHTFQPDAGGTEWTWPLFAGSLFLLLISFRHQHLVGVGLGVAGLFYFTVQYYYDLRWSLLNKSVYLIVAGAVLLLAYALLRRRRQPPLS